MASCSWLIMITINQSKWGKGRERKGNLLWKKEIAAILPKKNDVVESTFKRSKKSKLQGGIHKKNLFCLLLQNLHALNPGECAKEFSEPKQKRRTNLLLSLCSRFPLEPGEKKTIKLQIEHGFKEQKCSSLLHFCLVPKEQNRICIFQLHAFSPLPCCLWVQFGWMAMEYIVLREFGWVNLKPFSISIPSISHVDIACVHTVIPSCKTIRVEQAKIVCVCGFLNIFHSNWIALALVKWSKERFGKKQFQHFARQSQNNTKNLFTSNRKSNEKFWSKKSLKNSGKRTFFPRYSLMVFKPFFSNSKTPPFNNNQKNIDEHSPFLLLQKKVEILAENMVLIAFFPGKGCKNPWQIFFWLLMCKGEREFPFLFK